MYQKFYGLREPPFGLTPDTDFFYANTDHQEALNTLLLALQMVVGLKMAITISVDSIKGRLFTTIQFNIK